MGKKEAWFYEPELARAKRRAELEAKIERAAGELANTGPAKLANSDAVALAAYLSALGIETSADRVNKLLVLLAVLVIECGGGLALAVGMALGDASRHSPETQKRDGVPAETQGVPESVPAAYPQRFRRSIRVPCSNNATRPNPWISVSCGSSWNAAAHWSRDSGKSVG